MTEPATKLGEGITGYDEVFAVLGHPIGHSLSPVMHNAALQAMGRKARYLKYDVPPGELLESVDALQRLGFKGLNLTVPLKEVAYEGLEQLDASARQLKAVNTLRFTDSGPEGFNTDGQGFLRAIQEAFGTSVKDQSILVLGTGGAGRAVALTSAEAGASALTLADTDAERPRRLFEEVTAQSPGVAVDIVNVDLAVQAAATVDLVVHATPVGMKPDDPSLFPREAFREGQHVFDLIYMYPETSFMRPAREAGARAVNGLGMLLHQGVIALELWTGAEVPVDVMRQALEEAVYAS